MSSPLTRFNAEDFERRLALALEIGLDEVRSLSVDEANRSIAVCSLMLMNSAG